MSDSDVRSFQIASKKDELFESNRELWKLLEIRQGDTALFFPAPNALVPLGFAKFMNKRKVTFVDWDEINVSTLIKLAAQMKLTNVTVKLAGPTGKFPLADNAFDIVYADWGLSSFVTQKGKEGNGLEAFTKEIVRVTKPGGKVAALEENGAPVMYTCPQEILSIRSKIDSPRAERLIMGRRVYSLFKSNGLKNIRMRGFSNFLTSDDHDRLKDELNRRLSAIDNSKESLVASGVTSQELEKYKAWLKSQLSNNSFLMQFNSILTIGEK